MPVVLQQDDRLSGQFARRLQIFGRQGLFLAFGIGVLVRVVEQSQFVFGFEDAAARLVDLLPGYLPFVERFFQRPDKSVRAHVHVEPGFQRQRRDLL